VIKSLLKILWHLLAVVGVAALVCGVWLASQGISARAEPGPLETSLARTARRWGVPESARQRTSPEPATSDTIREGSEHWADHCASCHANNGSGDTSIGRNLYPRAPDMRLPATQGLSDGELFFIIENGIKLTGMPAWATGTEDGERASWHLVQFIRRLPALTETELAAMEDFNPRSLSEWQALEDERRFLSGETPAPPVDRAKPHHKGESR
jgi:mono/diheme cytochrome c family protein